MRPLPPDFPQFKLGPSFGQWWRIHSAENGPWWFASDSPERPAGGAGRFDLPKPHGSCYLGNYLDGVAAEVIRESDVPPKEAQEAANKRCLSVMPLDRWYALPIADFTSAAVEWFGAPTQISELDRADARPWAAAAHAAGFGGILYRLGEDPKKRLGLALFGRAGENVPPFQPPPALLPVGLQHELTDLFDGEHRGDPVLK
jgi:hypothetical protein